MKISRKSVLPFKENSLNSLKGAFLEQELSSEDDTNNFKSLLLSSLTINIQVQHYRSLDVEKHFALESAWYCPNR